MSESLDVLIQKREAELSPLRSRMEELKLEFIREMVLFSSDWIRSTVKEYIAKYPQVTLSMSEEKIAKMKAKIAELLKDTEKTVSILNNSALWWHQKPDLHDSKEQYLQVGDKYPEILDRAVRHVLGQLGIILEEFRFHVTVRDHTGSYEEFWFDHSHGADSLPVPYYPHLLKWTEGMQNTIRKYNSQYLQALEVFEEIQRLKEEKKRQQAMSRWDSI